MAVSPASASGSSTALPVLRPDPAAPGFKHFFLKPAIVGDVVWAKGVYNSIYGRIVCHWAVESGRLAVRVKVPANTTATVYIPAKDVSVVTESGQPADKAAGVEFLRRENACAVFELQSGDYEFKTAISRP